MSLETVRDDGSGESEEPRNDGRDEAVRKNIKCRIFATSDLHIGDFTKDASEQSRLWMQKFLNVL